MDRSHLSDDELIALAIRRQHSRKLTLLALVAFDAAAGVCAGWLGLGLGARSMPTQRVCRPARARPGGQCRRRGPDDPPKDAGGGLCAPPSEPARRRSATRPFARLAGLSCLRPAADAGRRHLDPQTVERPDHLISVVTLAGAAILTGLYLAFLTGHAFAPKARPAFDDELSRAHRAKAFETGFWTLLGAAAALFSLGLYRADGRWPACPWR